VVLTDKGKQTFDATMRLQAPWINSLSEGLSMKDIQTFQRVVIALREKLETTSRENEAERIQFANRRPSGSWTLALWPG
jgi:hypothetical protein